MENTTKELFEDFTNQFKDDIFEYDVENHDDLVEFLEFIKE